MPTTVDTRGKVCPLPLILFRQALKDHPEETEFEILTDNAISCSNLTDFIRDQKFPCTETTEGSVTRLSVRIPSAGGEAATAPASAPSAPASPAPSTGARNVVVFTHRGMGHGDKELGHTLIKSFLTALAEVTPLPERIICYNTGAYLAAKGSPVLEQLQKLEQLGVDIVVCGLCTDYLSLKDRLAVGRVSNMLSIAEYLTSADKVLYP